jgi:glycosyltransferase involved in cell wall biosynthesis
MRSAIDTWLAMTYRVADSIACSTRKQVELLSSRGVPTHKLSYVPVWVDESVFYPRDRDDDLAATLGVSGKKVLLYAGTIGEPQGLDTLVRVCAELKDRPDFHCLIAGTGLAEGRLRAMAAEHKLDNVSFLGRWPTHDMTRLMSVGDIHFVSLRSNPLAEIAMPSKIPATLACGKPLIVAAGGEAAAVVARSGAGWTCAPGDARDLEATIRIAIDANDCTHREMGRRAREAYESEFAVRLGVERIERLLAGEQQ